MRWDKCIQSKRTFTHTYSHCTLHFELNWGKNGRYGVSLRANNRRYVIRFESTVVYSWYSPLKMCLKRKGRALGRQIKKTTCYWPIYSEPHLFYELLSWCFEPSQPRRITSRLIHLDDDTVLYSVTRQYWTTWTNNRCRQHDSHDTPARRRNGPPQCRITKTDDG